MVTVFEKVEDRVAKRKSKLGKKITWKMVIERGVESFEKEKKVGKDV